MTRKVSQTIGILALQGAFQEHLVVFKTLASNNPRFSELAFLLVRTSEDLSEVDALVIPVSFYATFY